MRGRGRHDRLTHCPRRLAEPEPTAPTTARPVARKLPRWAGAWLGCARGGPLGATNCTSPSTPSASSTRPTTRSCRDPGRPVPKAVEHQDEEAPFWRRPSPTTPTSTSSLAARPQTRPSPASSRATPRRRAASGTSLTRWDWCWQGSREMSYSPASWRFTQKTAFSLPCSSYTASPPRPNLGTTRSTFQGLVGASFPRGTSAQRTAPSGARGRATRSTATSKRRSPTSTCTTQSRPRPRSYSTSGTRLKGRRRQPIPASFSNRPSS